MADETVSTGKGGRPRLYAPNDEFEKLRGRVAALEVAPPAEGGRVVLSDARDDREFVERCMTALIAAQVFTGGDADLAPMAATVTSLVVTRDLILNDIEVQRDRRLRSLRESGYLRAFGVMPETVTV